MSRAYFEFSAAVHLLTGPGTQRERLLQACLADLAGLQRKEIPLEARAAFDELCGCLRTAGHPRPAELAAMIDALSEADLAFAIDRILTVYDLVARYQPTGERWYASAPMQRQFEK